MNYGLIWPSFGQRRAQGGEDGERDRHRAFLVCGGTIGHPSLRWPLSQKVDFIGVKVAAKEYI